MARRRTPPHFASSMQPSYGPASRHLQAHTTRTETQQESRSRVASPASCVSERMHPKRASRIHHIQPLDSFLPSCPLYQPPSIFPRTCGPPPISQPSSRLGISLASRNSDETKSLRPLTTLDNRELPDLLLNGICRSRDLLKKRISMGSYSNSLYSPLTPCRNLLPSSVTGEPPPGQLYLAFQAWMALER